MTTPGDVEVVAIADLLSDRAVDAACENIWPLAGLGSDDARAELRRDVRRALTAAVMASTSRQSPGEEEGTDG